MNIKRICRRVRRDRANTNGQIDPRSGTHACIRMHIQPVQQSDATRRSGAERGGTGRDGECETRLCGQAERVLDCGSPLCPTHPPTAPRKNAPLAFAGSACCERDREWEGPRKGPRYGGACAPTGCEGPPPASLNDAGTESNCALAQRCDLLIPFLSLESSLARSPRHSPRVPRDLGPGPLVELFPEELTRRQPVSFRCANE